MKLTLFYLPACPHCKLAFKFLDELRASDARYAAIEIEKVDESSEVERAYSYDYWYVPCFYLGDEKLHEGHAELSDVKRVLDRAASGQ
ncbi:MAG: glutaredoxin domain-containing protein [Oscillospiraceae bacterium]